MSKNSGCITGMKKCSMGVAPTPWMVVPLFPPVICGKGPLARASDTIPFMNIIPFGICNAKPPVPSPIPCIPAPAGQFTPSSKVQINSQPAVTSSASVTCSQGGNIEGTGGPHQPKVIING